MSSVRQPPKKPFKYSERARILDGSPEGLNAYHNQYTKTASKNKRKHLNYKSTLDLLVKLKSINLNEFVQSCVISNDLIVLRDILMKLNKGLNVGYDFDSSDEKSNHYFTNHLVELIELIISKLLQLDINDFIKVNNGVTRNVNKLHALINSFQNSTDRVSEPSASDST